MKNRNETWELLIDKLSFCPFLVFSAHTKDIKWIISTDNRCTTLCEIFKVGIQDRAWLTNQNCFNIHFPGEAVFKLGADSKTKVKKASLPEKIGKALSSWSLVSTSLLCYDTFFIIFSSQLSLPFYSNFSHPNNRQCGRSIMISKFPFDNQSIIPKLLTLFCVDWFNVIP